MRSSEIQGPRIGLTANYLGPWDQLLPDQPSTQKAGTEGPAATSAQQSQYLCCRRFLAKNKRPLKECLVRIVSIVLGKTIALEPLAIKVLAGAHECSQRLSG